MRIRSLFGLLGAALLLAPLNHTFADDTSEIRALVEQSAKRYQGLDTYLFDAVVKTEGAARGVSIGGAELKVQLAGDTDGRFHFEIMGGPQPFITISDGQKTWEYMPKQKAYTEEEGAAAPSDEEQATSVDADQQARFKMLLIQLNAGMVRGLRSLLDGGSADYKFGGQKVSCRLARMAYGTQPDGSSVIREVWIEPETKRVLKSVSHFARPNGGEFVQTVLYQTAQLGGNLPGDLFNFVPPGKAKKVDMLQTPGATAMSLVNKPAPNFALKTILEGDTIDLSELRGKVVVLDFWATWCPPCRRELPSIAALKKKFEPQGVVVLGINDERKELARNYLQKHNLDLPTLDDSKRKVHTDFRIRYIPSVFIIDRSGKVVNFMHGTRSEEELAAAVQAAAK